MDSQQEYGNENPADGCSQDCGYKGPDPGTEEKNCFRRGDHSSSTFFFSFVNTLVISYCPIFLLLIMVSNRRWTVMSTSSYPKGII